MFNLITVLATVYIFESKLLTSCPQYFLWAEEVKRELEQIWSVLAFTMLAITNDADVKKLEIKGIIGRQKNDMFSEQIIAILRILNSRVNVFYTKLGKRRHLLT